MTQTNRQLIFHTVAWAAAMLAVYALAIQWTQPNIVSASTSSLGNRVFVERYVYGHPAESVIVGSSLTRRLPSAELGPRFTNLALDGQSALTGMAIVASSPATPKRIYIEINQVALGADTGLLRSIFEEPIFSLRKKIAALRATYRPTNLLYALIRGNKRTDASGSRAMTPKQRQAVLAETSQSLRTPHTHTQLLAVMGDVRSAVTQLRLRGIQTVFFEMPVEPEFRNLPLPSQIRAAMRAAFPASKNCWAKMSLKHVETLDGLHLTDASAAEAAANFRQSPHCEMQ